MSDNFEKSAEQGAAFQKIWMESMSKLMQSAFTLSPNSPPPDVLKQIRSGIFEALARQACHANWERQTKSRPGLPQGKTSGCQNGGWMSETSTTFANPVFQWQRAALEESFAAAGRLFNAPTLWQRAQQIRKGVSP